DDVAGADADAPFAAPPKRPTAKMAAARTAAISIDQRTEDMLELMMNPPSQTYAGDREIVTEGMKRQDARTPSRDLGTDPMSDGILGVPASWRFPHPLRHLEIVRSVSAW